VHLSWYLVGLRHLMGIGLVVGTKMDGSKGKEVSGLGEGQ